jgi:5'-3' exonuclease
MYLNSILYTIKKVNPTKVIIALDERIVWRHDIYPQYKANRKGLREKSVIDFQKFFPVFNDFSEDMKQIFSTIYFMKVPKCEADDVIAVLVKEKFAKENCDVIIVSTDGDMKQLLQYKNVTQYDPFKGRNISSINPTRELELKVLTGDKGDNIPAVRPKFGKVSAEKVLQSGLRDFIDNPENKLIKENYERNIKLINFNFIPKNICDSIINTFNQYNIKEMESTKILSFFTKNRMAKLMDSWQDFSGYIKALK